MNLDICRRGTPLLVALFIVSIWHGGRSVFARGAKTSRMTFLVLATSGTVRQATTRFVAEVRAASPEAAMRKHLPATCKHWLLHSDSRTKTYARIENPISFVSDAIDNYSAQTGRLLRNTSKELRFRVELVQGLYGEEKSIYDQKIWAKDAKSALNKAMKDDEKPSWSVVAESKYRATAAQKNGSRKLGFSRYLRARVQYELHGKHR